MTVIPEQTAPDKQRPLLLLDVDGVLNAVTVTDPPSWGDWQVTKAEGFSIRWSPSMIAALTRLSERVEMRWLTTWWDMTDLLAFLGLPSMEVANTREEYLRRGGPLDWWKLPVVQRVYGESRPVIWIDDDLRFDRPAMAWVRSLPADTFCAVSPDTYTGLVPEAISDIEAWLDTSRHAEGLTVRQL